MKVEIEFPRARCPKCSQSYERLESYVHETTGSLMFKVFHTATTFCNIKGTLSFASKPGMGKSKGGKYERDLAKQFSGWITGNKDNHTVVFWRSSLSGGRSTVMQKAGLLNKEQAGDMSSVSPEGNEFIKYFLFEYKHYKDLQIPHFLTYRACILREFWDKVVKDATKLDKIPILVAKQNNFNDLLITTPFAWNHLTLNPDVGVLPITHLTSIQCQVMLLDDFFKHCKFTNSPLVASVGEQIQ